MYKHGMGQAHYHVFSGQQTDMVNSIDPKHTHKFNGQITSPAMPVSKMEGNSKDMKMTVQDGNNNTITYNLNKSQMPFSDDFISVLEQLDGTFCFTDKGTIGK